MEYWNGKLSLIKSPSTFWEGGENVSYGEKVLKENSRSLFEKAVLIRRKTTKVLSENNVYRPGFSQIFDNNYSTLQNQMIKETISDLCTFSLSWLVGYNFTDVWVRFLGDDVKVICSVYTSHRAQNQSY